MDPISGLGLLALVKDVVELGFKLKSSVEKSKWNRKRLRRLADEVLSDLYALQTLYNDRKDLLEGSSSHQLALAIDRLRSEMWHVFNRCQTMISSDSQSGSIKSIGTSFKAWNNRDVIDQEILDLRNRVRDCYLQFTTLTVARIESTILVHRTENTLMLRRLELAGNQMLVGTDYGQTILSRIGKEIAECSDIHSVERQYFSLQASRISDMIPELLRTKNDPLLLTEQAGSMLSRTFETVGCRPQPLDALIRRILGLSSQLHQSEVLSSADVAFNLSSIFDGMDYFSLLQERKALGLAAVEFYRAAALHNSLVMPYWALCLINLSGIERALRLNEASLSHAKNALTILDMVQLSNPEKMIEIRPTYAWARFALSSSLEVLDRKDESLAAIREAVEHFEVALDFVHSIKGDSAKGDSKQATRLSQPEQYMVYSYFYAISNLSRMVQDENPCYAFALSKRALCLISPLSSDDIPERGTIRQIYLQAMTSLTSAYIKGDRAAHGLAEDAVSLFRRLAKAHPRHFSLYFLRVLYIYTCVQQVITPAASHNNALPDSQAELLRTLLYDGGETGLSGSLCFYPEGSLRLHVEHIKAFGPLDDVICDTVYAAGTTHNDELNQINSEVADGIRSFIGTILCTYSNEASRSLESFQREKPHLSPLSSVLISPRFLPIPFLRSVLELSDSTDLPANNETHLTAQDPRRPSTILKAQTFCRATLYFRALEVIQQDPAPDLATLALVQAFLGRFDEAGTTFCASLETEDLLWGDVLIVLRFMETLFRQGRYCYALQVAKNNYHYFDPGSHSDTLFSLHRAMAYVGDGNLECAVITCEKVVSTLRAMIVKGWTLPMHFQLSYALTIMARCLIAIGSLVSAFGCAEESASFYRMYNVSDECIFWTCRFDRALSYQVYASILTMLGDHDRALIATRFAITIYEEVGQDTPCWEPEHASTLETLAKIYWSLDQRSEALTAQRDAVQKWVEVASKCDRLGKNAAASLDTLADYLVKDGKAAEAVKARENSIYWKARHVVDSDDFLNEDYWETFPDDCPEGFNRTFGRFKPLEAPLSLKKDFATSTQTLDVSLADNEAQVVVEDKEIQSTNVETSLSIDETPPPSMISSAVGWFGKLVEQSVDLPIDSVAVL